jgi:RimJ/RimL family protein N-acetyltransferase
MPWTVLVIETERLRLRAWRRSDEPVFVEMLTSIEVRRYLGGPMDPDAVTTAIAKPVGELPNSFCIALADGDVAIGGVSLGEQHGEPELSYELVPSAWRQGFATEAITAFLDWAWTQHAEPSMIAVTQTANVRSRRLLARLGFVADAEFEEWGDSQTRYRLPRPGDQPHAAGNAS